MLYSFGLTRGAGQKWGGPVGFLTTQFINSMYFTGAMSGGWVSNMKSDCFKFLYYKMVAV